MTKQITLEEALKLVSFYHGYAGEWEVLSVHGDVKGNVYGKVGGDVDCGIGGDVHGNVEGDVDGNVGGDIHGDIYGDVVGNVRGTINGCGWKFVETPKEKLQRLLDGASEEELRKLINQLENN